MPSLRHFFFFLILPRYSSFLLYCNFLSFLQHSCLKRNSNLTEDFTYLHGTGKKKGMWAKKTSCVSHLGTAQDEPQSCASLQSSQICNPVMELRWCLSAPAPLLPVSLPNTYLSTCCLCGFVLGKTKQGCTRRWDFWGSSLQRAHGQCRQPWLPLGDFPETPLLPPALFFV